MMRHKAVWSLLVFILVLGCAVLPSPEQPALRKAYENASRIDLEAELSGDTSHLKETFTSRKAEAMAESIKTTAKRDNDDARYQETEVAWVRVLDIQQQEATIEVKEYYRTFRYDRKTGTRHYYDEPHRYWNIWRYRMIKEDGIWKFDDVLEFVDWSG